MALDTFQPSSHRMIWNRKLCTGFNGHSCTCIQASWAQFGEVKKTLSKLDKSTTNNTSNRSNCRIYFHWQNSDQDHLISGTSVPSYRCVTEICSTVGSPKLTYDVGWSWCRKQRWNFRFPMPQFSTNNRLCVDNFFQLLYYAPLMCKVIHFFSSLLHFPLWITVIIFI